MSTEDLHGSSRADNMGGRRTMKVGAELRRFCRSMESGPAARLERS